jgi:hypothetical protein
MEDAISENVWETTHFAWIDFNITQLFKHKEQTLEYLRQLSVTPLSPTCLVLPGCWPKPGNLDTISTDISWRFCGGFFLGDADTIETLGESYRIHFGSFLETYRTLPWDVNFWAYLEHTHGWMPTWYKADHNDTIVHVSADAYTLELSIEIAQEACHNVSKVLKQPHDFEYEKTFMPFCLLSKKRYVSIKYDFDPKKGKRNEMGIVLKRRDNAPIVKDVYGGVIDILMKEKNIQKAIDYVTTCLQDLVDGKVPIEKLIITKSLRSFYKNPQGVAHKVLADRIGQRDPGNKPTSGDRIAFVYIVTKTNEKGKKVLQGDKIETPTFIKENGLQIDYSFYITNQIMKPLLQLFGLVLEDIWLSQKPPRRVKANNFKKEIENIKAAEEDYKKGEKKINKLKDKEVQALIFDKYLRDTNNAKDGNQSVMKFFGKK